MKKLCCIAIALLMGCTTDETPKTVPAEGIVTLDGTPVDGAVVILVAAQGSINATAITDKQGKFQANAFEHKTGAVPGDYKVTINKTDLKPASDNVGESNVTVSYGLPEKYSTLSKSGLSIQLGELGNKEIKFELSSKK
jgi:hypothetical protein